MITKEDVTIIQSELTEEQWKKFVYLLSEPELNELKKTIKVKAKEKFVVVMRRYINKYINQLNSCSCVRLETTNLLIQSKMTLKNVYKLIDNNSIVDANALLRSCFENIMMAMLINYDDNTYNEFLDLSTDYEERKYTKPFQITKNFGKLIREIDSDLLDGMTSNQLRKMLDDFYKGLCLFTHSTLMVNVITELRKEDNSNIYVVSTKLNAYFIEIMLYLCLKHLCGSKKEPIDITYVALGWFVLIGDIPREQLDQNNIEKLKLLLHIDQNRAFFEKNNHIIEQANALKKDIDDNPLGIIYMLKELIKK